MSVAPLMPVPAPPLHASGSSSNGSSSLDVAVAASSLPTAVVESVAQQLSALGLAVQPAWLRDALAIEMREGALPQLQAYMRTANAAGGSGGGAAGVALPAALLTACRDCAWSRALLSSLLRMGARRLPPLRTLNTPTLPGTHVLQLLECVDVAHSANQLAEKAQWEDRVWKLLLTDGQQPCTAFERRRCQSLSHAAMKPGVKLAIRDVPVRHSVLMLEPGNVEVLGGGCPPDEEENDAKNGANGVIVAAPPMPVAMQPRAASAAAHVAAAAPAMAPVVARQSLPGASAAAAAAAAMAAHSTAVAPAAPASFVAASTMMAPQQPQPSLWAIRSQQQAAAAAAAGSRPQQQQPPRQPAPSTAPPPPAAAPPAAATSFGKGNLPLPLSRDDDLDDEDAWMEEEEEALRELEEEESRRQAAAAQQQSQAQPPHPSGPSAQPLFTVASLLASGSNGEESDDVVEMDRGEDKDMPPLSQSMPGLETAPPILDYVSPVISKDNKHAEETPMASVTAASPAAHAPAPALAPAADVFSLLTPPDRAPAPAAVISPHSAPALTPMSAAPPFTPPSTAFSTVATVSSPAVSSATVPAASSILASNPAVQVKAEKGVAALESHSAAVAASSSAAAASSSAAPAPAPSRPAPAASSTTVAAAPSRAASRSTTASPGKVKKEGGTGAGAGAGSGTLDAFLARGSRDKTQQQASSRCSSPASDGSSVMLVSPPKKPAARPAPARGVKPEALAARFPAAAAADDDDDFLESTDAPTAPILPQMAPALPSITAVADEVSPAVLQRGREASQEAASRLFPLKDPLRPHFLSLPYTFLHLLPILAQRIERPLHVLVHAHIVGVCSIRLEIEYALHVQIQDDHSVCNLRFSPSYVEALLGCNADRLAQLDDSVKETLYDRLQAKIEAPPGIMQLRIHPRVRDRDNKRDRNERVTMQLWVAIASLISFRGCECRCACVLPSVQSTAEGGVWLAGSEPEIMDMRAATNADTKMMQQCVPLRTAITTTA